MIMDTVEARLERLELHFLNLDRLSSANPSGGNSAATRVLKLKNQLDNLLCLQNPATEDGKSTAPTELQLLLDHCINHVDQQQNNISLLKNDMLRSLLLERKSSQLQVLMRQLQELEQLSRDSCSQLLSKTLNGKKLISSFILHALKFLRYRR